MLTLTPGKSLPSVDLFTYDKVGHAVIFMVLTFLYISGLYENKKGFRRSVIIGFGLTAAYSLAIEIAQKFIPDRMMDWKDLAANIAGAILGLILFSALNRKNAR